MIAPVIVVFHEARQRALEFSRASAVLDAQHGGFTTGSGPVSWGSIDSLSANLTVSIIPLPAEVAR